MRDSILIACASAFIVIGVGVFVTHPNTLAANVNFLAAIINAVAMRFHIGVLIRARD